MVSQATPAATPPAARPHYLYPGDEFAVLFQGGPLELYNSSCCKAKPLVLVDKESVLEIPVRSFSREPLTGGYGLWSPHVELADHFFGGVITNIIEDLPAGKTSLDVDREAYERVSRRSIFITMGTARHTFPDAVEKLEEATLREFNRVEAIRLVRESLGKGLCIGQEKYQVHLYDQPLFMYELKGKYHRRKVTCVSYSPAVEPDVELRFTELVNGVGHDFLLSMVRRLQRQYPSLCFDAEVEDSGKIAFSVVYVKNRVSRKSVQNLPAVLAKIEKEIAAAKVQVQKAERGMEKH